MKVDFQCNLCGSETGHTIPFRYAFKNRYLWAVECDKCQLISIWPRPTDAEITEMYAADYFTGADKATHHMDVDYLQILNSGDYKEGVDVVKKHVPAGGNILEIGCATGNFLFALKNAGFKVKGVELSSFAVDYAHTHFGIQIINKPFDQELIGNELHENEFDLILMGDVLEHFTNPTEAMIAVNRILKPGGVALIQVPGTLNLISSKVALALFRVLGTQKTMTLPPYHLTEFSAKTVRELCKRTHFSRVKIEQHIKHPKTIPLRGSFIENIAKKYMQYPNYYLTKWFGVAGDRIHIEAYK